MEPLTQVQAQTRARQIVQKSIFYTFHIKLMVGELYEGVAEVFFTLACQPTDVMIDYTGDQVISVSINGAMLQKVFRKGRFIVLPGGTLVPGQNSVIVHFRSKYDQEGAGCISSFDQTGQQYLYTYFEPCFASRAVPVFDQPDLKGKMTLNVITPPTWRVASNEQVHFRNDFNFNGYLNKLSDATRPMLRTVLQSFLQNCQQTRVHCFPATALLPSYLFCWIAGEYCEISSPPEIKMSMNIFCTGTMINRITSLSPYIWEVTTVAMDYYTHLFGCPYPFTKYEFAFADNFRVMGMEHPGLVTLNSSQLLNEKSNAKLMFKIAQTICHQLAHSWFGNLTTMKWWDDLWLKESFADFISYVCIDKIRSHLKTYRCSSGMVEFHDRKKWGYRQDGLKTTHPIRAEVVNTDVAESIFDGITYSKGAAVLSQLMFIMGEASFSAANAAFFKRFAWENATFDDMIAVMQQHFQNPNFTLSVWKELWLERACLNEIEPVWEPETRTEVSKLRIRQSWLLPDHTTLRMHKIKVAFFRKDCTADAIDCWVLPQEWTTIQYNGTRDYEAVFLNYEQYSFVKVSLDPKSFDFFEKNLSRIQDDLTRSMLWTIFFDMVCDARISSILFIDLFIANIALQASELIFVNQFDAVYSAVTKYTPAKYQDELGDKIFFFLIELVGRLAAQPEKVEFVHSKLTNFLISDKSKRTLLLWWEGNFPPLATHKLTLGQQWEVVTSVFTLPDMMQEKRSEVLKNVMSRTNPASVGFYLTKIEALKASKEQLKGVYQSLKNLGNPNTHGTMAGFVNPIHQAEIQETYTDRFFSDMIELAESCNSDASLRFFMGMQPGHRDLAFLIQKYEEFIPKIKKHERLAKQANETLEEIRKRKLAHYTFEKK